MSARLGRLAARSVLGLVVVLFMLPVLWLISTAYKPPLAIFATPPQLTFTPTLDNFRTVFRLFDVVGLVRSSLIISGGSVVLSLLLGVPAGYALARSTSRTALALAYFFLAIRMVPAVAALIPFYLAMRDIGLLGTWWAVILLNAMLNAAFVTWMMFSYFRSLPRDLCEAALTDGCTPWGAFVRIELPVVRAGIIASALFCLIFAWNDFLFGSFLTRLDTKPISVALLAAYGTYDISWGTLGALAHFSTLPIVILAVILNRFFVQGLTKGVH